MAKTVPGGFIYRILVFLHDLVKLEALCFADRAAGDDGNVVADCCAAVLVMRHDTTGFLHPLMIDGVFAVAVEGHDDGLRGFR